MLRSTYSSEQSGDTSTKDAEFLLFRGRHKCLVRILLLEKLNSIEPGTHRIRDVSKGSPLLDVPPLHLMLLRSADQLVTQESMETTPFDIRWRYPNKLGRSAAFPAFVSLCKWMLADVRATNGMCDLVLACSIAWSVCYGQLAVQGAIVRDIDVLDAVGFNFVRALESDMLAEQRL